MGDMGDLYNDMKADAKARKQRKLEQAESMDFSDFRKHTPWHWSRTLKAGRLDYYPTKDKWIYDKTYYGSPDDLRHFVEKHKEQ